MSLDSSDIEKLAVLSRIEINQATVDEVAENISNVLKLVDQLQAADTDGVAPMAHPMDAVQVLRADNVTETNHRDKYQACAPATQDGLYLVPRVVE